MPGGRRPVELQRPRIGERNRVETEQRPRGGSRAAFNEDYVNPRPRTCAYERLKSARSLRRQSRPRTKDGRRRPRAKRLFYGVTIRPTKTCPLHNSEARGGARYLHASREGPSLHLGSSSHPWTALSLLLPAAQVPSRWYFLVRSERTCFDVL